MHKRSDGTHAIPCWHCMQDCLRNSVGVVYGNSMSSYRELLHSVYYIATSLCICSTGATLCALDLFELVIFEDI